MRIIAIESLADQIARYLEQQIVSGARIAGSRIVEGQVAAQLAVSRGSVREAMLLLQRRHLISLAPRRAPEVSQLTAASARHNSIPARAGTLPSAIATTIGDA